MPFEKKVQLNYSNLSEATKLRFLELEIQSAIETLTNTLFSSQRNPAAFTKNMIASYLVSDPAKEMLIQDLIAAFSSYKFRSPLKEERIQYFRYKRIGVAKVVKYARVAPNTVQDMKDQHPNFTPVFNGWLSFPNLINNWDKLKSTINFFNDELIQTKDNHLMELTQAAPEEDEY